MRRTAVLAALLGLMACGARAQVCTLASCVNVGTTRQIGAQFNVDSATINGQLTVGQINVSTFNASTVTAGAFIGPATLMTSINASNIALGNISSTVVVGAYPGITSIGTLNSGTWNAQVIGTQYGGTGQNFVTSSTGDIAYFGGVGTMTDLRNPAFIGVLETNGNNSPLFWVSSPTLDGSYFSNIPLTAFRSGQLPTTVSINDASISTVSASKVIGNISGEATALSVPLPVNNLAGGTLSTANAASSITVTGVQQGVYGGPTQLAQLTVATDGRIIQAEQFNLSSIAISTFGPLPPGVTVSPSQISTGTFPPYVAAASVTATGTPSGTFGGTGEAIQEQVGTDGRIYAVSQSSISVFAQNVGAGILQSGVILLPTSVATGTFNAGVILPAVSIGTGTIPAYAPASSITASGVNQGIYGSSDSVIVATVTSDGRITSAASIPISIPGTAINSPIPLSILASGSLASNIVAQTISTTGVNSGIYGSSMSVAQITVGFDGRISSAVSVSIAGAPPSGSAGGSLAGTYPNPSIAASGVSSATYGGINGSLATIPLFSVGPDGRITSASQYTIYTNPIVPIWQTAGTSNTVVELTSVGASTNVVIQTTMTVQGNAFSVGGSTLAVSSGKVGIGTVSPAGSLDVEGPGTICLNGGCVSSLSPGGIQQSPWTLGNPVVELINPTSSTNVVVQTSMTVQASAFSVGASTFVVTNGNVGIGNIVPSHLFEIGQSTFNVQRSGHVGIDVPSSNYDLEVGGYAQFDTTASVAGNGFNVGGSTLVVIGGNVGIGNMSPDNLLQVSGLLNFQPISGNTFVGNGAGGTIPNNLGNTTNVAVGSDALGVASAGNGNTALGANSLFADQETTGGNTAVGSAALFNQTTGNMNTAVGRSAGVNVSTGTSNIIMGNHGGSDNTSNGITSGSSNIAIGNFSGQNILGGNNNIVLANSSALFINGKSNTLDIGDSIFGNGIYPGSGVANIGVDITTPTVMFEVGLGSFAVTDSGAVIDGGSVTVRGSAFSVGGSTLVVSGGNVGIGTASPQYMLDDNAGSFSANSGTFTVSGPSISMFAGYNGESDWSRYILSSRFTYLTLTGKSGINSNGLPVMGTVFQTTAVASGYFDGENSLFINRSYFPSNPNYIDGFYFQAFNYPPSDQFALSQEDINTGGAPGNFDEVQIIPDANNTGYSQLVISSMSVEIGDTSAGFNQYGGTFYGDMAIHGFGWTTSPAFYIDQAANGVSGKQFMVVKDSNTGNDYFNINGSGFVGIMNQNPIHLLDVGASTFVVRGLGFVGIDTGNPTFPLTVNGAIDASSETLVGASGTNALTISSGNISLLGRLGTVNATLVNASSMSVVYGIQTDTLAVVSTATFNGNIRMIGSNTVTIGGGNANIQMPGINSSILVTGIYASSVAVNYGIMAATETLSTSLGIGTNSPTTALSVYGIITSSSPIPSISCTAGTPTISTGSTSSFGSFASGTAATSCTVTFTTPFPKTPFCECQSNANLLVYNSNTTSSSLTCTAASVMTGDTITYICHSPP